MIILGHIASSFIRCRIACTGAKDIAIVAVETAVTGYTRSAEKLAEEIHDALLNTVNYIGDGQETSLYHLSIFSIEAHEQHVNTYIAIL